MWPRPRDLAALQDQCLAVLYSMADAPRAPETRRRKICLNLHKVGPRVCVRECVCDRMCAAQCGGRATCARSQVEEYLPEPAQGGPARVCV